MSDQVFKLSRFQGAPISDEELIADLRRVAELLATDTLTMTQYDNDGKYGHTTQQSRFGTWNDALLRSGLKISKAASISAGDLIADIRRVAELLGKNQITMEQYKLHGRYGYETSARRFGSWDKALLRSGLNINNISDEELIADLRRVAESLKTRNVTRDQYTLHGKYSRYTLTRRFGGWDKALVKSGLSINVISDEELIADLCRVAELLKTKKVTGDQYKMHGKYGYGILTGRFNSWNNALHLAGLDISLKYKISDVELFENILTLWQHYGRQPRIHELTSSPSCILSCQPYKRRFGSWWNALKAFVDYANTSDKGASDGTIEEVAQTQIPNDTEISIDESVENLIVETTDCKSETVVIRKHKTNHNPSIRLRWRVLQRDNFKCRACGASPAITLGVELHVDHIDPWSKGGETVLENLQTLCSKCNYGKSNLLPEVIDLQSD